MKIELAELDRIHRPKRFEYIPTILSVTEVKAILGFLEGRSGLAASLHCGTV